MRIRTLMLSVLLGGTTVVLTAGCMGKPENSPTIRKRFTELDQMKKSLEEVSSELQYMTTEVRRLTEENKELRAIVPGIDGATPALQKIDDFEKRLVRVESIAAEGGIAGAAPSSFVPSFGSDVASNTTTRRSSEPVDLESASLAVSSSIDIPTKPAPSVEQPKVELPKKETAKETRTVAAQQQVTTQKAEQQPVRKTSPTQPKAALKPSAKPSVTPAPASANSKRGGYHLIAAGDTIEKLAQKYGVPAQSIISANKLPAGARLPQGQRLFIPAK